MESKIKLGSHQIDGNFILAPMDGFTDQPFRWLCRHMGSSLIISEFINVLDVPDNLNDLYRRASFSQSERPFGFQLYGSNPELIIQAAVALNKKGPDFIDLNLGCSVRRIAGRGAGAGLLRNPEKIRDIISELIRVINIPVTAKIRLGWNEETQNYIHIANIIEKAGASLITVHARTRNQSWNEPANWTAIHEIVKAVSIPVIGNGDIHSFVDGNKMMATTGCNGVMIGRSAIGNPWIFSKLEKGTLSRDEILRVTVLHWQLMVGFYGANKASILFKKHLKAYFSTPQFSDINIKSLISMRNPMQHELFYS